MPLGLRDSELAFSDDAATETTGGYAHEPQDRHAGRTKRLLQQSSQSARHDIDQKMSEENVETEGRPPYLHVRNEASQSYPVDMWANAIGCRL